MSEILFASQIGVLGLFVACQLSYTASLFVNYYLRSLPVNWVDMSEVEDLKAGEYPRIVLFYPVLRELEETMRTTFRSLSKIDYPPDRFRVVAIPNANDEPTVRSLRTLAGEFAFLEVLEVPATPDPSWNVVWRAWQRCEKAYWWHHGARAGVTDLPPKKTRQLVYAFYTLAEDLQDDDFLVNYIDADSCPPPDHFLAAAVGMKHYDVLQAQNIAGNLNDTMASSFHAMDHMAWDGLTYPHLSANGKQPYWVLGKGLFFRASDLIELGGFHPWLTIEDPEVGMRFWTNGKRLGIIENPLIEEVPLTFHHGVTQRKRWVAGFFQSLAEPLKHMGMTRWQRFRAWLNFLPCLSLSVNSLGLLTGIWAMYHYFVGSDFVPMWIVYISCFNIAAYAILLASLYSSVWKRSTLVTSGNWERVCYIARVNPIFLMLWWLFWIVPLFIGLKMYVQGGGLVWERTVKINANNDLIIEKTSKIESPKYERPAAIAAE
jgi:cellulose synthase/poly-beta-1,6-N-acetylglucosamine synthase-like glycosyltransferase